jgi:hypothetical protein
MCRDDSMLRLHSTLVTHIHRTTHTPKRHQQERERERERETQGGRQGGRQREGVLRGVVSGAWRQGEDIENVRTLRCAAKRLIPLDADVYGGVQNTSSQSLGGRGLQPQDHKHLIRSWLSITLIHAISGSDRPQAAHIRYCDVPLAGALQPANPPNIVKYHPPKVAMTTRTTELQHR